MSDSLFNILSLSSIEMTLLDLVSLTLIEFVRKSKIRKYLALFQI